MDLIRPVNILPLMSQMYEYKPNIYKEPFYYCCHLNIIETIDHLIECSGLFKQWIEVEYTTNQRITDFLLKSFPEIDFDSQNIKSLFFPVKSKNTIYDH